MRVTLKNNNHQTEIRMNLCEARHNGRLTGLLLSEHQAGRAKKELCPSGCTCGDELGLHGRQDFANEYVVDIDTRSGHGAIIWIEDER